MPIEISAGIKQVTSGVSSVNGKTGVVVLTNTDVGAAATSHTHTVSQITDMPTIPTKTSELTNDSGFLTEHQSLAAYSTTEQMNTAIAAHHDTSKQDTLTAGSNITISGTTISATDTTYSAGTNITIDSNNVISATGEPSSYIKSASVSGRTLTLTDKDNTPTTFTDTGSVVSASSTGTSSNEINYLTIDSTEYKIAGSGGTITDVQVNGTSVVTSGVANIVGDSTPTSASTNLVTSGGVYTALSDKVEIEEYDSTATPEDNVLYYVTE